MIKTLPALLLFVVMAGALNAQQTPYQPGRQEIMERYRKAKVLDSIATRSIREDLRVPALAGI